MNSESAINVWTERPKWFGRINIEEYEKLASIGYTPQQIAMYYDIDVGDFMFYFTLLRSPLKYPIRRRISEARQRRKAFSPYQAPPKDQGKGQSR